MSRSGYVAVIDIGKTNKKVHVYDSSLSLVDGRNCSFDPVVRDGIPWIPSEAIEEWLLDTFTALSSRYEIRSITVTTHGATFACVDESGGLALPVIDYTHEPGEEFHRDFYRLAGSPAELQRRTATLELKGLINVAKGIYFLKRHDPERFARTRRILFYPQYLSFRLTGLEAADYTYAACHTYLFDFGTMGYGDVADRLDVRHLLPERLGDPATVLGRVDPAVAGRTGLSPETVVTFGIHDSNASLLPYLVKKGGEDMVVNSTGTWCVAMHPEREVAFSEEEIGKAVFFNMSALRQPVKTSILVAGLEFDAYTGLLRRLSGMKELPAFNPDRYREMVRDRTQFILPTIVPGTGQFPDSAARVLDHGEVFPYPGIQDGTRVPPLFADPARAFAALNLSLAIQTVTGLERVGARPGTIVYTEGGFRGNRDYNALLASLLPGVSFRLSGMPEATSFGAAMVGWAAIEQVGLGELADRFELEEEEVSGFDAPGLREYAETFWQLLR